MSGPSALIIGGAAGLLCYAAVQLKRRLRYDDVLDVVGVHMVGGVIGVLLTGVFASLAVNAAGASGGWSQLGRQAILAVAGIVYPFIATLLVLWVTDRLVGLRLTGSEEDVGLDLSQLSGSDPYSDAVAAVPTARLLGIVRTNGQSSRDD